MFFVVFVTAFAYGASFLAFIGSLFSFSEDNDDAGPLGLLSVFLFSLAIALNVTVL